MLAALVSKFSFEPADPDKEVEIGGFLIAKPDGGLRLKIRERKDEAASGAVTSS